jgi:hypothetical protein
VAILQKGPLGKSSWPSLDVTVDLLAALEHLRTVTSHKLNTLELIRGAKLFDRDKLYLVKPTGQRFWTETAALNDADEIAGTILMNAREEA